VKDVELLGLGGRELLKKSTLVIPAQAGIQILDPGFRRGDG
jgi:hypothetical protein